MTRPAFSTLSLSYWVTMPCRRRPGGSRARTPTAGLSPMTTPAACLPAWRFSPSSRFAMIEQLAVRRVLVVQRLEPRLLLDRLGDRRALALDRLGHELGDACRPRRTAAPSRARCRARPPRALSWCNVAIWPTLSLPYLSVTYVDHLVAPVHAEVDVEVRHADTRSGFRKRSNSSLYAIGSMSVMRSRVRDQRSRARAAARARPGCRAPWPSG